MQPPASVPAAANPVPPAEDPTTAANTRRLVVTGAAFMIVGRLAVRCISVISTLILARLLVPEDFGIVALAAAIFAVVDLISTTNFALVVVRRASVDRSFYDTAWTMNLLRCLLLGGLVALTAEWQAGLMREPRLTPVLMLIALNVAMDGLASIGLARLQREMRFDLLFRQQVVIKIAAFIVTIVLAYFWRSYWALVLGHILAKFIAIPYGYWLAPHRPRFSLKHWRELLSFSKWSLLMNACAVADGQGPNLVLGRMLGMQSVGMYNIAYQVAATPVTEIAVPVRGPIYAGYARSMHDKALLGREFLNGFGFLFTVLLPLSVGIALVAPEIERIALGPRWEGVAPLMTLCALYALFDAMAHFNFNMFTVLDQLRRFVTTYSVIVLVRVPAVVLGAMWAGAEGALAAMLATGVLNAAIWHHQVGRLLGHGLGDALAQIWRGILAAAAMAAAVLALRGLLPPGAGDMLQALRDLSILAPAGAAVHVATQLLLWQFCGRPDGPERRLLNLAGRVLTRLRPRRLALSR
ncbi:lipopolysaccharide biosynthesis protein [Falsiroseomonas sp.]|uniref:lipopolysaccharide biosynthesis protein n=1 Tax=Falsiroseomonas sp. TaxID=2870721 RepID=UPI00272112A4|nr:lipopolysaccharide biosynthesis protein [Falsiroseomonas sp.]MDO9498825.1 lipopolysaccharide biosynthesis protein [Falsiroseomonas sp.]